MCSKITVIFKFRELRMFDFRILSLLCWYTCLLNMYVDNISHFGLSDYYSKKWIQKLCIKFCVKNKFKCARTFEMLTVALGVSTITRTQIKLWYNRSKERREALRNIKGNPRT